MKTKALKQQQDKPIADLRKDVEVKKTQIVKTKLEFTKGAVKNVRSMRNLRRDIAQLMTIINQKQFEKEIHNV